MALFKYFSWILREISLRNRGNFQFFSDHRGQGDAVVDLGDDFGGGKFQIFYFDKRVLYYFFFLPTFLPFF